jgi:subtilase family serine protease
MGNSKQRRILRRIGCPAEIEAMEQRLLLSVVPHFKPSVKAVKSKTPAIHAVAKAKSHKAVVAKAAKATASTTVVPTVDQAATLGDVVTGGPYATPLGGPSNAATAPFIPAQIAQFYGINAISFQGIKGDGTGQTIGIVDAYNNPDLVSSSASNFSTSDLHVFDTTFGLPDPPSFTVVPAEYSTLTTDYNANWAIESALDVEWAHALAPKASIVLVDCNSSSIDDLVNSGVAAAQNAGASVISMSFAFSESGADTYVYDPTFSQTSSITYVAGTGDLGAANTAYPSLSPYGRRGHVDHHQRFIRKLRQRSGVEQWDQRNRRGNQPIRIQAGVSGQ